MADGTGSAAPSRIGPVRFLAGVELKRAHVEDIVARVSRRLAVPCHLDPAPWACTPVHLSGRDQVDADLLLASLDGPVEPGSIRVGLTGLDLGLPIFTYVFGRAHRGGHAAVVSLARLSPERYGFPPDPDLAARRAVAEIMHELGHVAGLGHCDDFNCIMHFSPNVESIDVRGMTFCRACADALPRNLLAEQHA
ncbi:MAG TPA: archemetzincin [Candidatus Krumholzibacteria bacterium]|nr:archemetzincin [Candidatus Krumholzibacteria bacterium]